jgi:hypothetical protein
MARTGTFTGGFFAAVFAAGADFAAGFFTGVFAAGFLGRGFFAAGFLGRGFFAAGREVTFLIGFFAAIFVEFFFAEDFAMVLPFT